MKKIITSGASALLFMTLCCAEMQVTETYIKKELHTAADSIRDNRNSVLKLDNIIAGKKGYFYIIKSNGKISYHPKKALINADFSGYSFVRKILNDRNGCISLKADGIQKYVFFEEIDTEEILCLAIDRMEFIEQINECNSNVEDIQ